MIIEPKRAEMTENIFDIQHCSQKIPRPSWPCLCLLSHSLAC